MTLQKNTETSDTVNHPSIHICLWHATLLPLLHTLLFGFSVLSSPCCSSAVWDTFQILFLIPTLPLLPDWFSHSPRPLPATTATQLSPVSFIVGMRTGLLWLRIELWESFAGSGRVQHRVSERMNSWHGKNLSHMGMWHMCVRRLRGAVHGNNWLLLQRETLVQIALVRPHVWATLRPKCL